MMTSSNNFLHYDVHIYEMREMRNSITSIRTKANDCKVNLGLDIAFKIPNESIDEPYKYLG